MSALPRLFETVRADGRPVSYDSHSARYGPLPLGSAGDLADAVAASGLTGRGGAAFPTGAKLAAVAAQRRRPVVLANGAEGEPASGKDKSLLAYVPHLVLDGALLAARAIEAREAIVATTPAVEQRVRAAVSERRERGLRVVGVPDRFVSGEETALVNYLNGGPARPTFTPPRPFERGVGGAPTLVLNVETLAQIALIARYGSDWFRSVGTPAEPGSVLVTLSGAVAQPGVYEVALGTPFTELLEVAGGATAELAALLVGGYFGNWIAAADARAAALSNESLNRVRASLGARALVAFPAGACGVAETARVMRYLADESAGQCGPCVYGLAAVAGNLEQLAHRDRRAPDTGLLRRRLSQIAGRGACAHPDGAVGLVTSALRVFGPEFERHAQGRRCSGTARRILPIPERVVAA